MPLSLQAIEKMLTMSGSRKMTIERVCDIQWHFSTVIKVNNLFYKCLIKMVPSVHKRGKC